MVTARSVAPNAPGSSSTQMAASSANRDAPRRPSSSLLTDYRDRVAASSMQEPPSEQIATAGAEVATAASSAHRYASRRHTRLMAEYRDRVAAINSTQEPPREQIVSTVGLPNA